MDPSTGEILAMANLPDFDPNNVRLYSPRSLKNLCVTAFYEPGSVFKIVSAAAMMKAGQFPLKESFDCPGSIRIGGKTIKCWKKHGHLRVDEILKYSCNVGMIRLALKMNPEDFYRSVQSFGFGSLTGVEMPGEVRGLLRLPHQWGPFSKGAISIGQELGVTPLQLITACAAVANGGNLLQPRIVKELRYPNNETVRRYDPFVIRRAISSNLALQLTSLLVKVTEKGGTGERAGLPRYDIAGKTGTAQVFDNSSGTYLKEKYILSFLGYYPVDNPQVIILVILRKPAGNRTDLTGGTLAAPVFHNIATAINGYRNIIPGRNIIPLGEAGFQAATAPKPTYNLSELPDFTGYNMKQTGIILNNLGLKANLVGTGLAYKQMPPAGSKIEKTVPVTVWFRDPE
jgi:cell division protein FtsI (penicillin-binding protein 3)